MFFILSKVLYFLLIPFWWIVILFVWMKISRNPQIKKRLSIFIIAIALLFTNPFLYQLLVRSWQHEPVTLSTGKTFEAGIVLGGMAGHDKYNRGYFGNNADRFIQAAKDIFEASEMVRFAAGRFDNARMAEDLAKLQTLLAVLDKV